MSTAQHWYSIPDKTIAKALKAGHPRCPTEIAIRPQTGDDVQRSLEADVRKGIAFMTKKVEATICGVNYDPKRDKAKRLVVSRAAESPELFPDYIFASLLGKDTVTRFRPHYFGYTEPSFEVDLSAKHLPKVNKDWIEIGGCGMVDPAVFEGVGYDPNVWSGYAFGMGLERLAMLMYGIDDIRYFYQNDLRFLKQFA